MRPTTSGTLILAATLALALHTAAADFGSAMMLYQRGDYAAAFREFGTLANDGDKDAEFVLGDMYANGQGVIQDYVQAHKWYNLAAAHGATGAAKVRDELTARMTPDQVAEAQKLAREWKPGQTVQKPEAAPARTKKPVSPPAKKPAATPATAPLNPTPPAPAQTEPPPPAAAATPPPAAAPTTTSPGSTPAVTASPVTPVPQATPPPAAGRTDGSGGGGFFSNLARGATGLLGSRRAPDQQRTATATIGIRGLSAEELRTARPDTTALQKMEGYTVSEGEAAGYAREAKLAAQNVPYLTEPAPAPQQSPLGGH